MIHTEFVGIREFSQKLFEYLKSNRPVVLMKHGKPFRILSPISKKTAKALQKKEEKTALLKHKAIGLWEKRWPVSEPSAAIASRLRQREEKRSFL